MHRIMINLIFSITTIVFATALLAPGAFAQADNGETPKTKSSLRVTFADDKRKPNRAADVVNANRAAERKSARKGKGNAVVPLGTSVKPRSKSRPSSNTTTSTRKSKSTSSGTRQLTTASSVQRSGRVPRPRNSSVYRDTSTSRKSAATTSRARGKTGSSQQTSRRAPSARPSAAQLAKNNGAKNPRALSSWHAWDKQTNPTASTGNKKKAKARKVTVKPKKRRKK